VDRQAWLLGRREAVEAVYDAEAPTYDENPYPADVQRQYVERLVATCQPGGIVLDAPCGTGQYFPIVAAAGRRVVGIDQSEGMLEQARARGIAVSLHHVGLQELRYESEFDAAMTVDAMENVFPEDWPLVLSNLRRAVRPGGHVYLTVEEVPDETVADAFTTLSERGLPVVRGEVIEGDVAGYHYYPGRDQVMRWLGAANLAIVEEGTESHGDWAYWHLILRAG
jgi:ubiquinone/menaquinone biosynthesis C-methylase UbiE